VLRESLDRLKARGSTRIFAVPGMLFAAMHAKNDIPSVVAAWSRDNGIPVVYGRELGLGPQMLDAAASRIGEALFAASARSGPVPLDETCLVVIGRGASDPDANSNVSKLARLLWEGMGFGWCETGYSGVTFPLVDPCLNHVARLGYRRVVVFPYFLFSGVLVDRIYGFTDEVAARHPDIEFVKAPYLGDHPGVLATFAERTVELDGQVVPPTCNLCKYRTAVLGFGAEVGLPQESHHHHVEGQGAQAPGSNIADCQLCGDFCTGECRLPAPGSDLTAGAHLHHDHADHPHHHHHGHPAYPHAHHPLGPESARKRH
jgi:sirohydrochlorin cobaltochelatase